MGNPKVYVGTKDGAPVVGITTDKHRELNRDNLLQAISLAYNKGKAIADGWDPKDWFPCGFASLWVDGRSPLVKLLKKEGVVCEHCPSHKDWPETAPRLSMSKAYGGGFSISWSNLPITGALWQCMSLKAQVYACLVEELAYLGIAASVRTMVD